MRRLPSTRRGQRSRDLSPHAPPGTWGPPPVAPSTAPPGLPAKGASPPRDASPRRAQVRHLLRGGNASPRLRSALPSRIFCAGRGHVDRDSLASHDISQQQEHEQAHGEDRSEAAPHLPPWQGLRAAGAPAAPGRGSCSELSHESTTCAPSCCAHTSPSGSTLVESSFVAAPSSFPATCQLVAERASQAGALGSAGGLQAHSPRSVQFAPRPLLLPRGPRIRRAPRFRQRPTSRS